MAEKRRKQEVQLAAVAYLGHLRVAEANRLVLAGGGSIATSGVGASEIPMQLPAMALPSRAWVSTVAMILSCAKLRSVSSA